MENYGESNSLLKQLGVLPKEEKKLSSPKNRDNMGESSSFLKENSLPNGKEDYSESNSFLREAGWKKKSYLKDPIIFLSNYGESTALIKEVSISLWEGEKAKVFSFAPCGESASFVRSVYYPNACEVHPKLYSFGRKVNCYGESSSFLSNYLAMHYTNVEEAILDEEEGKTSLVERMSSDKKEYKL